MNLHYLIPLLKKEWKLGIWILPLSIFFFWLATRTVGANSLFLSSSMPIMMFPYFVFFTACKVAFPQISRGTGTQPLSYSLHNLEFVFTLAVPRSAVFYAKTSLCMALPLLTLVLFWIHAAMNPEIRIEVNHKDSVVEADAKQLYLSQFRGAHIATMGEAGAAREVIVLPHAQATRGMFFFLVGMAGFLVFQCGYFVSWTAYWRTGWLLIFMIGWGASIMTALLLYPSFYEKGIAWVEVNPVSSFASLGVLFVLTQLFCCRRFVQRQIFE
jgi:hypothetical protein